MEYFFAQAANPLLLPPALNLVLLVTGFLGLKSFRRTAISLIYISSFSLALLTLPKVSDAMLQSLETTTALDSNQLKQLAQDDTPRAILVLSAGRTSKSPEYDAIDSVNATTLQRLHYTSWLHKKTQLPVLLSGGKLEHQATPEAVLMNRALLTGYSVTPGWIESKSRSMAESAHFSSHILEQANISEILLVTHAWQMARAKREFQAVGFKVIAAPMGYLSTRDKSDILQDYTPSANALLTSSLVINEKFKLLWFELTH